EDPAFQVAERGRGFEAEFLDERLAGPAVEVERLRLPPVSVEGDHQLAARPLAQRVVPDERFELREDLRVPAELELGVEALLERDEPQFLQARDRGLGERLVGEVGKGRTAPEPERLAEQVARRFWIAALEHLT